MGISVLLLMFCAALGAISCSQKNPGNAVAVSGPSQAIGTENPSSFEAIRRGLAPVTPPGSPLKDVHFEFDTYSLPDEARETLKANAAWLNSNSTIQVEIEGHADDLGDSEYNLALGAKRAQSAREYLVSLGVPGERLAMISYGEEAPVCTEPTEECRKQNRRARFIIVRELPTS